MVEQMIVGPTVYSEHGAIKQGGVIIRNGQIAVVDNADALKKTSATQVRTFPEGYHLVPGFIDLHVHGANGKDVMDATADAFATISKALAEEGTTAFLATTMTAAPQEIENTLMAVQKFIHEQSTVEINGAQVLGVHLEGPFIAPSKVGAQRADKLLELDVKHLDHWQRMSHQVIKIITLAPELAQSSEFIRHLKEKNIIAAMGHSDATYKQALAAIQDGCTYATHLFNAMRGMHHREPGLAGAALLSKQVMVELIVDGLHVHPAMVDMAVKLKGKDGVVLVTDAMRAKCLGDGSYDLGGQTVQVKAGVASLADGTLAGSLLKMSGAVKKLLQYTDCTLTDAIKLAAANPAKVLNIFNKKGSIGLNKDADLVVLDEKLNVVLTLVGGKEVFNRK